MENEKRFVKYPREKDTTTPYEALVYVVLRSYMDNRTLECYPSIRTISEKSNLSKATVTKAINGLLDKEFISKRKDKNRVIYRFNEENKFEPFSYEFLEKEDLTPLEKGILILSQQYMLKNEGFGDIWYSNRELAEILDISKDTLNRAFRSLRDKGYLNIGSLSRADKRIVEVKQFNLSKLEQAIVFKLAEHEERIQENANEIEELKARVALLEKELKLRDRILESNKKRIELNNMKEEEFRKLLQED